MAVSAEHASIGCMVTPSKLLREICSGRSRRCEDLRCWLPAGTFAIFQCKCAFILANRQRNDVNRARRLIYCFALRNTDYCATSIWSRSPVMMDVERGYLRSCEIQANGNKMTGIVFYGFDGSTYVRTVRMLLAGKGAHCEQVPVNVLLG